MRESAQAKGRRLLTEGRLTVTEVDRAVVRAACRGDSGTVYNLGHNGKSWGCTCPAKGRCSHLVALQR